MIEGHPNTLVLDGRSGKEIVRNSSTQLVVFEIKHRDLLQFGEAWEFAANLAIGAVL